ncbi:MAG: hypothetical protein FWE90_11455 [Defluviitaleaceae bacterium]|nr:hypothetical protein [Defluviitaleaceae bacterium]
MRNGKLLLISIACLLLGLGAMLIHHDFTMGFPAHTDRIAIILWVIIIGSTGVTVSLVIYRIGRGIRPDQSRRSFYYLCYGISAMPLAVWVITYIDMMGRCCCLGNRAGILHYILFIFSIPVAVFLLLCTTAAFIIGKRMKN